MTLRKSLRQLAEEIVGGGLPLILNLLVHGKKVIVSIPANRTVEPGTV